jgi:hypothetical protein
MSNELISVRAWIEKHSFDLLDSFSFLVGKTLDGMLVRSLTTKVSETALDSYLNDVRAAQKRKPPNKGLKKARVETYKQESLSGGMLKLKRIVKPTTPPKDLVPKKLVAFTRDVSKVVDPAILARIQKSKHEKAAMQNTQRIGNKPSSVTKYSGNLRVQPRQIENLRKTCCLKCKEELNNEAVYCSECGVKQSQAFLEQKLNEADKIYIDTCSLMETPIEKFFEKANPILRKCDKEIIISIAVKLELKRIAIDEKYDSKQKNKAINALDVTLHSDKNEIKIKNEEGDDERTADQVFKYHFEKYRNKYKMLLISQDSKLSKEILSMNNSEAVHGEKCAVCRINDEGELCEFVSKSM